MPIIESQFRPPRILRPAAVQTIVPALFRRQPLTCASNPEILELPDGDMLELEWYSPRGSSSGDTLIILAHGLEGSTRSPYIIGLINALTESHYEVLAWNMRGCGENRNRLLTWYHSGHTCDLASVVRHAIARYPHHSVTLIGVSVGGNILCKYLGELAAATPTPITHAIAISPPLDLQGSATALAKPSRTLYMNHLLKPLRARMREKALRFPGLIDVSPLNHIRTFHEFDRLYTAPLHGFSSVEEYWAKSSAIHFLSSITIPTFILSAKDDPFLSAGCFPVAQAASSQRIFLEVPTWGGHVGFIDSLCMKRTWLERRVLGYLANWRLDKGR
jgi:predicted alpha/beta-fold hydrolase